MRGPANEPPKARTRSIADARYRDSASLICAALLLALVTLASRIATSW